MAFYCQLCHNFFFVSTAFEKAQANVSTDESDASVELSSMNQPGDVQKKGMILPFEPHSITFDDVKYSVDMPQVI